MKEESIFVVFFNSYELTPLLMSVNNLRIRAKNPLPMQYKKYPQFNGRPGQLRGGEDSGGESGGPRQQLRQEHHPLLQEPPGSH